MGFSLTGQIKRMVLALANGVLPVYKKSEMLVALSSSSRVIKTSSSSGASNYTLYSALSRIQIRNVLILPTPNNQVPNNLLSRTKPPLQRRNLQILNLTSYCTTSPPPSSMTKKPVKYFVVDSFTDAPFKGNPAAICFLEEDRDDEWLLAVAKEFNVADTGFLCPIASNNNDSLSHLGDHNPRFGLRWFTPVTEVKICGHATLAAAHILFKSGLVTKNTVEFSTLSGVLTAKKVLIDEKSDTPNGSNGISEGRFSIELDFPTESVLECNALEIPSIPLTLNGALVVDIKKSSTAGELIVELASGKTVADLQPHLDEIHKCPGRGLIVTGSAPSGSGFDFFSRFFCPKLGVNEDPVTGSIHCALAPYWSKKLGKCDLKAYQASPRGGVLDLHLDEKNHRLLIRGEAVTVMEGCLLA